MAQIDLKDYVNVDYFEVNNIEFTTELDDVDKEYVVVNHGNTTDTDTMSEDTAHSSQGESRTAVFNMNHTHTHTATAITSITATNISAPHNTFTHNGNGAHFHHDDAASVSDGGHSDTATSTQILSMTLSSIQAKMDNKLQIGNLQRINQDIQCRQKCRKYLRIYKLLVFVCSMLTLLMYTYYYYCYFHVNTAAVSSTKPSSKFSSASDYNEYNAYNEYNEGYLDMMNHEEVEMESEHEEYYEYKFQQNYYQYRYGYYHDYNSMDAAGRGGSNPYTEYNDMMSYLWQMILFCLLFVVCFTSFQVFSVGEAPSKNE